MTATNETETNRAAAPAPTLGCSNSADVCRANGWGPGTQLVGDEGPSTAVIEITAVGEQTILAKTVSRNGRPFTGREGTWTLAHRDWREHLSGAGGDSRSDAVPYSEVRVSGEPIGDGTSTAVEGVKLLERHIASNAADAAEHRITRDEVRRGARRISGMTRAVQREMTMPDWTLPDAADGRSARPEAER